MDYDANECFKKRCDTDYAQNRPGSNSRAGWAVPGKTTSQTGSKHKRQYCCCVQKKSLPVKRFLSMLEVTESSVCVGALLRSLLQLKKNYYKWSLKTSFKNCGKTWSNKKPKKYLWATWSSYPSLFNTHNRFMMNEKGCHLGDHKTSRRVKPKPQHLLLWNLRTGCKTNSTSVSWGPSMSHRFSKYCAVLTTVLHSSNIGLWGHVHYYINLGTSLGFQAQTLPSCAQRC